MIVVTVELLPGGSAEMRRTIASMHISNMSSLADISDYRIQVKESGNPIAGAPPGYAECLVLRHDRRQSVLVLLLRACEEIMKADWVEL
jgi:hypothetical protein